MEENHFSRREYVYGKVEKRERKTPIKFLSFVFIFIFIVFGVMEILKLIGGKKIVIVPGTVSYDNSLTSDEQKYLKEIFDNNKVASDVKISAKNSYNEMPTDSNILLSEVYVPVGDFYGSTLNISSDTAKSAFDSYFKKISDNSSENSANTIADESTFPTFIPLESLTENYRLLSIDNEYYLDTKNSGAVFRVLVFDSNDKTEALNIVKEKHSTKAASSENTLSFAQTGVTALTRAMTLTLNGAAGGDGAYFAAKIKDFLSKNDLTHISNEVSFIDGCQGGTGTMSLCADWRTIASIEAIGTDIVELSGNHNNNYGTSANLATIAKYHELNMNTVGGGKNSTEASKPLRIYDNSKDVDSTSNYEPTVKTETDDGGYTYRTNNKVANITFLAYNSSTSTVANGELATDSRPGANQYTEAKIKSDIAAAKARGDFIIVDIQYFECYSYPEEGTEMPACDYPISEQKAFFRNVVDMWVDMVVGTQAHQPQTYEIYNGKPIYYGLGNLFFDQTYWPGTQRGLILTHYFRDGKLIQTRISPTFYEKAHQVYLLDNTKAEAFIKRLMDASPEGK